MKKRQTITLAAVSSLGPFQFDMYLPALPDITRDLGTSQTLAQSTVTASLLGMATGQLLMGPLSDAYGRKKLLVAAMLGFVLAALACAYAPNIYFLIAARYLLGVASAAGFVIVNAFIRDNAQGMEAAKLFTTQASITSLAPIVAPLVGGQLLLLGDWRFVFQVLAGMGVVISIAIFRLLWESHPHEKRTSFRPREVSASWLEVIKDSRMRVLALTSGLMFFAISGFLASTPYAMEEAFNITPTQYTFFFASVTLTIFISTRLNAKFLGKFGPVRLLQVGLGWLMLAALVLGLAGMSGIESLALTSSVFAFAFIAMGFIMANATTLVMESHGARAGVAAGLMGFSVSFLGSLGALMPQALGMNSLSGIMGFVAITFMLNGALTLLSVRWLIRTGKLKTLFL